MGHRHKMETRMFDWASSVCLVVQLISTNWVVIDTAEIKLTTGLSANQGRVEIKFSGKQWRPLQDGSLGNIEAKVVCRQLGYMYGINQLKVYKTTIPDFLLDKFTCSGGERELGECLQKPGPPISTNTKYYYAGVCCSNSPAFQERTNGAVLGQCSVTWKEALQRCEEKNMTLSWSPDRVRGLGDRLWTGEFFTAWIWSDGCYTVDQTRRKTQSSELYSPQACLQYCGDTPDTQFALSGNTCICLGKVQRKAGLKQAEASKCNTICTGYRALKCGDGAGKFWSLYSLARQDDVFYNVDDPVSPTQCAVLLAEGFTYDKLKSEECSLRNGYICSDIRDDGFVGYIPFAKQSIYNVSLQEARQRCDAASTFHLAGRSILHMPSMDNKDRFNRLWVNIQRTATAVQIPNGKLSPSLCISVDQTAGSGRKQRALHCEDRNMYTCLMEQNPPDSGVVDTTSSSSSSNSFGSTTQGFLPIIIAVAGAVVLLAILVVVCCLRRKYKKKQQPLAVSNTCNAEGGYELIQRNDCNKEVGGLYDEINAQDTPPENHVYYDLEETKKEADLLKDADIGDDNSDKMPLKEKISYAFPKDSVKGKHSDLQSKDSTGGTGVDYDTPYDILLKKKVEGQEDSTNEIHTSDGTTV